MCDETIKQLHDIHVQVPSSTYKINDAVDVERLSTKGKRLWKQVKSRLSFKVWLVKVIQTVLSYPIPIRKDPPHSCTEVAGIKATNLRLTFYCQLPAKCEDHMDFPLKLVSWNCHFNEANSTTKMVCDYQPHCSLVRDTDDQCESLISGPLDRADKAYFCLISKMLAFTHSSPPALPTVSQASLTGRCPDQRLPQSL